MLSEYLKHLVIRTPLEGVAHACRRALRYRQRRRHPELREMHIQPLRVQQVMRRVIRDSANCVDIGCHIGSMLSRIMRLAPRGRHLAFEPLPSKARWLRRKFPEVDVRELALSDRSGEVTFYENQTRSGCSALRRGGRPADRVKEITVRCEPLDRVVAPGHRIDFMKIVVEGGELRVLRGADQILRRDCPVLLFECTAQGLSMFDCTAAEILAFLSGEHRYSVFLVKEFLADGDPVDVQQLLDALNYPFKASNLVAVTSNQATSC